MDDRQAADLALRLNELAGGPSAAARLRMVVDPRTGVQVGRLISPSEDPPPRTAAFWLRRVPGDDYTAADVKRMAAGGEDRETFRLPGATCDQLNLLLSDPEQRFGTTRFEAVLAAVSLAARMWAADRRLVISGDDPLGLLAARQVPALDLHEPRPPAG